MKCWICLAVLLFSSATLAQTTRPVPQIERMILISIDGCRPDLLLRAECPNVRSLIKNGSFSFWARTTAMSITLPSHVSMLTGVIPQRHGIMWNEDLPLERPVYPKFPTLFELAHNAGYSTALISGKSKFKEIVKPGLVDWQLVSDARKNELVVQGAIKTLTDHQPQLCFVHFPEADVVGHNKGWATDLQIKEIEAVDAGIGQILKAVDELKLLETTAILITADHGGAGRMHVPDDARSRHIPWIISGPGIRKNYDLTQIQTLEINTEDTFATACFLFGLKPRADINGKPIKEILADRELMSNN